MCVLDRIAVSFLANGIIEILKWIAHQIHLKVIEKAVPINVIYFVIDTYQTSRESTDQNSMDLAVLVRELEGVNWFNLGIQLNVSKAKLNKISQQYSDHMRCLTEMLSIWLDSNPNASWTEIAVALKYSSECELATNLVSKYSSRTYSDGRGKENKFLVIV